MEGFYWPVSNQSMADFRIGKGVLVKPKWIGWGGSSAEPAAMNFILEKAPSVPIPEVLNHWEDLNWFCYFITMREAHGVSMWSTWYSLEEAHRQRLVKEIALHLKTVGDITSPYAVTADGKPLSVGPFIRTGRAWNTDIKGVVGPGPSTADELFDHVQRTRLEARISQLWGDKLHLCHKDTEPEHFFHLGRTA